MTVSLWSNLVFCVDVCYPIRVFLLSLSSHQYSQCWWWILAAALIVSGGTRHPSANCMFLAQLKHVITIKPFLGVTTHSPHLDPQSQTHTVTHTSVVFCCMRAAEGCVTIITLFLFVIKLKELCSQTLIFHFSFKLPFWKNIGWNFVLSFAASKSIFDWLVPQSKLVPAATWISFTLFSQSLEFICSKGDENSYIVQKTFTIITWEWEVWSTAPKSTLK